MPGRQLNDVIAVSIHARAESDEEAGLSRAADRRLGSSLRASAGSSCRRSSVVPRLRWCVATRSYRRTAGAHRKAARPLRRYWGRASGRLCSTELHHHQGHDLLNDRERRIFEARRLAEKPSAFDELAEQFCLARACLPDRFEGLRESA